MRELCASFLKFSCQIENNKNILPKLKMYKILQKNQNYMM